MNINSEEIIKQINKKNENDKTKEKIKEIEEVIKDLNNKKMAKEGTLHDLEKDLLALKGIKNFIFNGKETRKKRKDILEEQENIKKEIDKLNQNISDSEKQLFGLKSQIESFNNLEDDKNTCLKVDDGVLLVDDSEEKEIIPIANEKDVIIHCTNFFPKEKTIISSYDGNLRINDNYEYKGVTKEMSIPSQRQTVHFTRNSIVQSHLYGNWDEIKYVIIEPFETHKDQFANKESTSDSWIRGSVKLGNNPIILIKEDEYEKVPKEELNGFTVIKFRGDKEKCAKKIMRLLGINPIDLISTPTHSNSLDHRIEQTLFNRAKYINFFNNNTWDGKTPISFSLEELFKIYDISNYENSFNGSCINWFNNSPDKFNNFLVTFGFIKDGDKYTIKSAEQFQKEMIEIDRKINENPKENEQIIMNYYDSNKDKDPDITKKLEEHVNKENSKSITNVEIDSSLTTKELFKFGNEDIARTIINNIELKYSNFISGIRLTNNGCIISSNMFNNSYKELFESLNLMIKPDINEENFNIVQRFTSNNVAEVENQIDVFMAMINDNIKMYREQLNESNKKSI